MTPANNGAIETRPCRGLVRHITYDTGGPILGDRQVLHSRQYAIGQDNLSAHIFSAVIGFMRPIADIYKGGFYVGIVTVIGQPDRVRSPISQQQVMGTHFP